MVHHPEETKDWSHLWNYRVQWVAFADDEMSVLTAATAANDALAASAAKGAPQPILCTDSLDAFVG
jgi:hypothetical protein